MLCYVILDMSEGTECGINSCQLSTLNPDWNSIQF